MCFENILISVVQGQLSILSYKSSFWTALQWLVGQDIEHATKKDIQASYYRVKPLWQYAIHDNLNWDDRRISDLMSNN